MSTIHTEISDLDKQIAELQKKKATLEKKRDRKHEDAQVDRYMHSYYYGELIKKHRLDEVGLWEVKGEDPNCDFAGSHHQPLLGYLEGRLEDAIKKAVYMADFWTWGGGGSIKKVAKTLVTKV